MNSSSEQDAIALARQQQQFHLNYPEELPVVQQKADIMKALQAHQVVVLAGETGSGKTTQLPKLLLELGFGRKGMIGHTQPRRLAARSVAQRIADEMKVALGTAVGYKVRFSDVTEPLTAVKIMTDGMLLAELQQDPLLKAYDAIIIDEAHERSLNIDFLLGILHQLLPKRPDLKLVITSATIETERFSKHFSDAPVITVSGRTFPVETRYRSLVDANGGERDAITGVVEAVSELIAEGPGDVLIFASGEREIRDYAEALQDANFRDLDILPLFARLSAADQNRVFQSHSKRRVVIATNVAETSLTVPGIRYVVDPGTARISRYSYRTKVQRLPIEPISQASANQRKGRCGRVAPGICIRLYSEDDFLNRPEFTDPEILRTNLAAVILQMTALRLGDIRRFPFIQKPDERYVKDGINLLQELHALKQTGGQKQPRLTKVGQQLSRLPLDPRLGRMVLAAAEFGCVQEVAVIVAALSIQDPRERPREAQQKADEYHKRYASKNSDFESYLLLWNHLKEQQRELSNSQFRKYCKENMIHFMRFREWQDIYTQTRQSAREMGLRLNQETADYDSIHRAMLTGLLSHIGQKQDDNSFQGARQSKFYIFPGSGLAKKSPKWVMSAELVETSRLFARINARIEPSWVEQAAKHLVKRNYLNPRFEKKQGSVVADEQVTLFGLIIVPRRKVQFGPINPTQARELFIREGLVAGQLQRQLPFVQHNLKLIGAIQELEEKSRRRDILVDDEALFAAYDRDLPENIYNEQLLAGWWHKAAKQQPELLKFSREDLMQQSADHVTERDYPEFWRQGNLKLPLSYKFEPTEPDDGVTLEIPLGLLNQLQDEGFMWLIPALREELLVALIKSLPKNYRRNFVPAPNYAQALMASIEPFEKPLLQAITEHLRRMSGVEIPADAWQLEQVPVHLRMNFRVSGNKGQVLAQGRNLTAIQEQLSGKVTETIAASVGDELQQTQLTSWSFGELPERVTQRQGAFELQAFPALVDQGKDVALEMFDTPEAAAHAHQYGLRKLVLLNAPSPVKHLQQSLSNKAKLAMYFNPWGKVDALIDDCVAAAIDHLIAELTIRTEEDFLAALEQVKGQLNAQVERIAGIVETVLLRHNAIQKRLKGKLPLDQIQAHGDMKQQLEALVYPGFVSRTSAARLEDLPRYLQAIERRLEKLPVDPNKDRLAMLALEKLGADYQACVGKYKKSEQIPKALAEVRWMLEELRVSLFAQTLKTRYPVSEKRIQQALAEFK
ncbi:ATP-dependent helicase HrpA [Pseudidiomarina planktonica]|uniref:ATP-dependent helicase HrpA n=1 Tax=Pseudidiomarina planktonica TaxID=1323738 RepID=A0A1Y6ERZ4_9GAMM|nr:ATP-dependent RNA helicase HrpA [Pseudidiomarina planktonica]SMQ65317.1 ATP-dependent helicase HrpA [Pseudidiomarina planktonica]